MADECPNPLLLGWLKEWMDEAQERNSKGYLVYKKAYQSMKACPLKFNHPAEAQQLNGLGPKLCNRLADKLGAHCTANGLPLPEKAASGARRRDENNASLGENPQVPKRPRKATLYVPKLRSGAYALIMALAELDSEGAQSLSKVQLIEKAQPHCDSSFTAPSDPTKFYTAWKSMQTLEAKEVVCTRGHLTKRYCLSDDGWEVANRMLAAQQRKPEQKQNPPLQHKQSMNVALSTTPNELTEILTPEVTDLSDISDTEIEVAHRPALGLIGFQDRQSELLIDGYNASKTMPIVLKPGSFEVKMLLDSREIRTRTDRDYIRTELKKLDVVAEIRALPLGDVLWVARVKPPEDAMLRLQNFGDEDEGSNDIVLEHVIERKRLDDLVSSIKDGRFHEQKFRLRRSGMRYVTYLVEDYSISAERSDKYGEALDSAVASMQIVNNIFVKQTAKLDDTIRYLARMTNDLRVRYESKELHILPSRSLNAATYLGEIETLRQQEGEKSFCITLSAFCALCDKSDSLTLRDIYLKMLMCTRGVTGDKAVEIQRIWQTPNALIEAYERLGSDESAKKSMISDRLGEKIPRKKVAKVLSTKIAEVWTV